jgi:hypothetical protein
MRVPQLMALYVQLVPAICCWLVLAWLASTLYPDQPRALETFYALLFVALAGTVGAAVWVLGKLAWLHFGARSALVTFAHGMVFSGLALFGLWLQSLRLLSPIHAMLLVGLYLFFEIALTFGGRRA